MPTALAALSPPPPASGRPGCRPQRLASAGRRRPARLAAFHQLRHLRFVQAGGRQGTSADQRRWPTSSHSVPEASDMSLNLLAA